MIVYCRTKESVVELADLIGCPSYTADSGTDEEKKAIIAEWLNAADPPAIVALLALGPRPDYPYVGSCRTSHKSLAGPGGMGDEPSPLSC